MYRSDPPRVSDLPRLSARPGFRPRSDCRQPQCPVNCRTCPGYIFGPRRISARHHPAVLGSSSVSVVGTAPVEVIQDAGELQLSAVSANSGVHFGHTTDFEPPQLSVPRCLSSVSAEPAVVPALVIGHVLVSGSARSLSAPLGLLAPPHGCMPRTAVVNCVEYVRQPRCRPRCSFRSRPCRMGNNYSAVNRAGPKSKSLNRGLPP